MKQDERYNWQTALGMTFDRPIGNSDPRPIVTTAELEGEIVIINLPPGMGHPRVIIDMNKMPINIGKQLKAKGITQEILASGYACDTDVKCSITRTSL